MERTEFHGVLDRRISRQHADCEVLANVFDPTALANRTEPQGDGFIEAFGADFGAVLDSFQIVDRDAAGADRHNAEGSIHSILSIAVKDDNGNIESWHAEILPLSEMLRAGWTKQSVKFGDKVTLTGRPGKYAQHIMWLEYLLTPKGRKLGRNPVIGDF
jgi:hypothetical protein